MCCKLGFGICIVICSERKPTHLTSVFALWISVLLSDGTMLTTLIQMLNADVRLVGFHPPCYLCTLTCTNYMGFPLQQAITIHPISESRQMEREIKKIFSLDETTQPGNTKGGSITVQLTSCLVWISLFCK
jgi:hypothetical protein